ncbi:hypothetical protein DFH06DRAFT_1463785 [Mycena polygramma]|nr:hypothetical protein DFH06DRAFT_1463785 [Mycena polygramma]
MINPKRTRRAAVGFSELSLTIITNLGAAVSLELFYTLLLVLLGYRATQIQGLPGTPVPARTTLTAVFRRFHRIRQRTPASCYFKKFQLFVASPKFSFSTTAEEVATAFADEIKGKNVLITGTSLNGIGFETARVIAKLKLTEEAIKKELPTANIRPLKLDLSSFAAIRTAAAEVNAYPEPIHVLIHNAAAAIAPFKLTVDKLESQAQTDHIGPFLLTKLIAPKILASATAGFTPRVVFVSSAAEAWGTGPKFQFRDAEAPGSGDLSKRSKGKINAYSVHPGGVLDANRQPSKEKVADWKTIPQGAVTTVAVAFDPRLNAVPGAYLNDSNEEVGKYSADPANAEKLWTVTEEIIGEKFTF